MDLEQILKAAREMRALYYETLQGIRQPLSISTTKFAKAVAENKGYLLKSEICGELGEHLRGMLLRYEHKNPKEAVILIADNNNECWKRFTYVKEVCHLYLDTSDQFTSNAEALAEVLLASGADPDPELQSLYATEKAAVRAALEIMIPESLRSWMAHEANVLGKTPFQIAFQLKTPRKYVEFRLKEWDLPVHSDSEE